MITSLTPRQRGEERQSPLVGMVKLTGKDLKDGAVDVFEMPNSELIQAVEIRISEEFDAGATIDVGPVSDTNAFLDDIALDAKGNHTSNSLPSSVGTGETIKATPSGVTTDTGECILLIQYVVADRAFSTQG